MMLTLALAAALFAADPPAADDAAAADLDGLQQMYDTSCANREYGAYDDMCDELRQQLHSARVEAARQRRRPHAKPAVPLAKTAPSPAPAPALAMPPAPKAPVPNGPSTPPTTLPPP